MKKIFKILLRIKFKFKKYMDEIYNMRYFSFFFFIVYFRGERVGLRVATTPWDSPVNPYIRLNPSPRNFRRSSAVPVPLCMCACLVYFFFFLTRSSSHTTCRFFPPRPSCRYVRENEIARTVDSRCLASVMARECVAW